MWCRAVRWLCFSSVSMSLVACGESSAPTVKPAPQPREVRTAVIERKILPRDLAVPGTLIADERTEVAFKIPGRVLELLVDRGSRVKRGDPIARLDPETFDLEVQQSEAALEQARVRLGLAAGGDESKFDPDTTALVREAKALLAEATLARDRARELVDQKLQPEATMDVATAAFEVADSRLQEAREEMRNRQALVAQRRVELAIARQRRADAELVAPFDGSVSERHTAIGSYLATGQSVATLLRIDPLRLRLNVPELALVDVAIGREVRFTVDGEPGDFEARVHRLSPEVDVTTRTLVVEALVENDDARLRPGSFARARIRLPDATPAVLAPKAAIRRFAGIEKLVLVVDGKATERVVRTGREAGDAIEIVSGLQGDEVVVVEPGNLATGAPVTVRPSPN